MLISPILFIVSFRLPAYAARQDTWFGCILDWFAGHGNYGSISASNGHGLVWRVHAVSMITYLAMKSRSGKMQ